MRVPLTKALVIGEGDAKKTLDALEMDLEALTGADIEMCVSDAQDAKGEVVRVLVTDLGFHIQVAAKASGIAVKDLRRLGARDYVEVATTVQAFLTGSV